MSRVMLNLWKVARVRAHYLNTTTLASHGETLRFAYSSLSSSAVGNCDDNTTTELDNVYTVPVGGANC